MIRLHIYAFGSLCRGDITPGSDIDLLAVVSGTQNHLSRSTFSIYSHKRIREIWDSGNPFAWHLHLEAKLINASDGNDYIVSLGVPAPYKDAARDCQRFVTLLRKARKSAEADSNSLVFDLSAAFLGIRNFASCLSLGQGKPDFSRNVGWTLMRHSPPISAIEYKILERARLLCTRGFGDYLSEADLQRGVGCLAQLEQWMLTRLTEVENAQ